MTKIYIARHGQDEDNFNGILNGHRDMPLTEIGISQVKELSKKIKESGITFDKVFSSPLKRAYNTCLEITNELNLENPEILDLLIERDFGIMSGKKISEIEEFCFPDIIKAEIITYFLSPDGGETFTQLHLRATKILDFIEENYKDKNILLVTHGDTGKMLYSSFYKLDWLEVLTMFYFGNSELILLNEGLEIEKRHVFNIAQYNH